MADSKDTIRLLESRRYTAMCEADAKTLEELLADSLVYTHSYGGADSKASYLDGIRSKKWQSTRRSSGRSRTSRSTATARWSPAR